MTLDLGRLPKLVIVLFPSVRETKAGGKTKPLASDRLQRFKISVLLSSHSTLLPTNENKTYDEASLDIFDYIEVFYNRNRRHSHLGRMTPEGFELIFEKKQPVSSKVG